MGGYRKKLEGHRLAIDSQTMKGVAFVDEDTKGVDGDKKIKEDQYEAYLEKQAEIQAKMKEKRG